MILIVVVLFFYLYCNSILSPKVSSTVLFIVFGSLFQSPWKQSDFFSLHSCKSYGISSNFLVSSFAEKLAYELKTLCIFNL